MKRPLIVYLDTQDLSRFGDVLRGKGDAQHERLFNDLKARKLAGDVVFPVTLPIMSELLQYDPAHRETTLRKAEAAEQLCGVHAMPHTTRLAAMEVARSAYQSGLIASAPNVEIPSDDRLWFPSLTDTLHDLRASMHAEALQSLAMSLPELTMRQRAEEILETVDWGAELVTLAPKIAEEVGLPTETVLASVAPFLRGEISSVEASQRMLSGILAPSAFVDMYFERWGPMGTLPSWISAASAMVFRYLSAVRDNVSRLRIAKDRKQMRLLVSRLQPTFRAISFELARMSAAEFELSDEIIDSIAADENAASAIPSAKIAAAALEAYTLQILGVTTGGSKIEGSVGGDVLHAFYLPYVDLWRGDRRFCAALRQALPCYRDRISGALAELPKKIEAELISRSAK
ncbi:hypothetical protein [Novosphingobium sediminicola]|uniref:Uncharacterized protein n=1 Tax=Novosphingobium sediminicola TaxID=563162 RepID=A0A7W6CKX2_9SPHN|nr:hypothetical protein [Novosphingobium sediminicola]MBB3956303.1 hypothetical protein [Novosphingobium sediminicola]